MLMDNISPPSTGAGIGIVHEIPDLHPHFTSFNFSIYLIIRLLMVIAAMGLLFKRSMFWRRSFIVMYLPILFETSSTLIEQLPAFQYLVDVLGFYSAVNMFYREVIYVLAILIAILISIIPNLIIQKRFEFNLKQMVLWLSVAAAVFFVYFKFNLKY
jgi:hypothetical protein